MVARRYAGVGTALARSMRVVRPPCRASSRRARSRSRALPPVASGDGAQTAPPLSVIFPGKFIGTYRKDAAVRGRVKSLPKALNSTAASSSRSSSGTVGARNGRLSSMRRSSGPNWSGSSARRTQRTKLTARSRSVPEVHSDLQGN